MGRIVASILISFVLVSGCSGKVEKDSDYTMTMKEFHELKNKPEKLVYRFNKMTKENRWKFFKKFLPGSILQYSIYGVMKFLKAGDIVFDSDTLNQNDKLLFGKWNFEHSKFEITIKQKKILGYSRVVIDDFKLNILKYNQRKSDTLYIAFSVEKMTPKSLQELREERFFVGSDSFIMYSYEGHGIPGPISSSQIREYCKQHQSECFADPEKEKQEQNIRKMAEKVIREGKYQLLSEQRLSRTQFEVLTKEELRLLRNTIFAKYGHRFQSEDLRKHFSRFEWYEAKYDDVRDKLSEIEKENVQMMLEVEKWRR